MPTPKEYQDLLEGGCPWCGESLEIKLGKYGEFITCSEWCGFTKNIPGRSFYPPPKDKKGDCPICHGEGLIPAKDKTGKLIPYAWHHCDCHPIYGLNPEPEHYREVRPEDFDFPCSDTFRGYSFEYCGVVDPGYRPPVPEVREASPLLAQIPSDKSHRLEVLINDLENRLNNHIDKSKKRRGEY